MFDSRGPRERSPSVRATAKIWVSLRKPWCLANDHDGEDERGQTEETHEEKGDRWTAPCQGEETILA